MSLREKRIVRIVIVVFVIIELIPVWLLQSNPPITAEPKWDSPRTRTLVQRACFDCHSNETVWPLYARIAPVSWLVTFDALVGRSELNFSAWDVGREERRIKKSVKLIIDGKMPPRFYLPFHPAARLNVSERQALIAGL